MLRYGIILAVAAAVVVALPFLLRRDDAAESLWSEGDPVVVAVSPHNGAIRREFGDAFAAWHQREYGVPAKVDWRVVGGTSEIMRYLAAEYTAAFRGWWKRQGHAWPDGGGELILDRRFDPSRRPEDPQQQARWDVQREMHGAFRSFDDPALFTSKMDVFFGGGTYDHGKAAAQGLLVRPWDGEAPVGLFKTEDGTVLVPEELGGEIWRADTFFGTALSTFGLCYNLDRLADLGVEEPPTGWRDLTDPRLAGAVGVADPTKSGSVAKAFELMVQEQMHDHVRAAGFTRDQVEGYERTLAAARLPPGEAPQDVPERYLRAVEEGWLRGMRLVQLVGANARYFTDGAGKVPIDVASGAAAAGLAIDFYGRFQAENSRNPDGSERMRYVTPVGGSSVSADPIGLLRGAENRETAVRFIEFVMGPEGQKLWNYRPGEPGGPGRYALRRLPVRRTFYPSNVPWIQARYEEHAQHTSDDLGDPAVDAYRLAEAFTYTPRWTAGHFGVQRLLIRAMCLDAGDELRAAWAAIRAKGGPEACPAAMDRLQRLPDRPEPLTWESALTVMKRHDEIDLLREWTLFFRESYAQARRQAEEGGGRP